MATVVVISDNEDADDDCVIDSVITVDNESESNLYHEVCKENKLLADFIKECLKLENSIGMQKILIGELLKNYHAADKTVKESPRFQKNLRRANYLLKIDPSHKFSHIQDLCNILRKAKVKKRVPFVTLSTCLEDKNCRPNQIKRKSTEQLDVINGTCKKAKLFDNDSLFSETNGISFNDTCDTMDDSFGMKSCSQQSSEEDKLLVPQRVCSIVPTPTEKKLKLIERKIAYYTQRIAILDEQEVDDDSVNSAYIKSERLKIKVVSLYKERSELTGNQPVKLKRIRLKLPEGRPPGPTRVLERFLNRNCNKDGDPPFPDFCDVVTCVTEANETDNLGWTKAQIMNEASALFTLCGRALQKRRQNREYRDLLYKVKMEDLERDPADDDPQLLAKLEENKRIAVKKESEILDRYTMLQYAAPKAKSQTKTTKAETSEDKDTGDVTDKINALAEVIDNNHNTDNILSSVDESENSNCTTSLYSDINYSPTYNTLIDTDNEEISTCAPSLENCSDKGGVYNKTVGNNVNSNGAGHIYNPATDNNGICNNNNDPKANKFNMDKNQTLQINSIKTQVNQKTDEDVMSKFKRLGDNYTLTVEVLSDS